MAHLVVDTIHNQCNHTFMSTQNIQTLTHSLKEQYFDKLESELVNFIGYSDGESYVLDTFILTNDEMAREIGFKDFADFIRYELSEEGINQPKWVEDWGRENLCYTKQP